MNHTLSHAINGCGCEIEDIDQCVICGAQRIGMGHVDTCGERCFKRLLKAQRRSQ